MNATKRSFSGLGYVILGALVAVGLGVGIVRLIYGLGPTTALSDSYPWGAWIIYDVFFVPFSAGAFMMLAVAHIYNRKEYHAVARPVVLAGFLGEIMVVAVLVMDLGRWHQFYNVLFPWFWNVRSFMFQVSICLTIYMGVMILEVAPAVLEKLGWRKPLRIISTLTVVIAIAGVVLSVLHQSSLGSLFLLMPYRVNPLWWTPLLPLLFFVSAASGGLSMAIFVVAISFRVFHRRLDLKLLSNLAKVTAVILILYLVLKFGDLLVAGEIGLLFSQGTLSLLFWTEILVGVVAPLVLFGVRRLRDTSQGLMVASTCALFGLLINRCNVALLGQIAPSGGTYVPNWMEIVISLAAVAAGILIFALAVRFLPILPEGDRRESQPRSTWSPRSVAFAGVALVALTALVVFALQPVVQVDVAADQPQMVEGEEDGCQECHLEADSLLEAGADPEKVDSLVIEPEPPTLPHGRIRCTTCHCGDESAEDVEVIHAKVLVDPSREGCGTCLACHDDLPAQFPEDRLQTPHDEIAHGEAVDVYCSDCHGGVGHGFDPVSGELVCPMSVCLDCHQSRNLDSELRDCSACHIGAPHEPVTTMACSDCHQSTDSWQVVEPYAHALDLSGGHAQVQCFECHQAFEPESSLECADCHEAPGGDHYGSACEDCHTPAGFADARLPDHSFELVGAHASAPCAGCHAEGQLELEYVCSDCHERPEAHLSGECSLCHTPQGWAESTAYVIELTPRIPHGVEGQESCFMCHDVDGKMMPAPSNHRDYVEEQCVLCHKAEQ